MVQVTARMKEEAERRRSHGDTDHAIAAALGITQKRLGQEVGRRRDSPFAGVPRASSPESRAFESVMSLKQEAESIVRNSADGSAWECGELELLHALTVARAGEAIVDALHELRTAMANLAGDLAIAIEQRGARADGSH